MSEKAKDKRLAFGAETGEVCDEELPKEIILLFQTSLRSFCLAEPTFAQDNWSSGKVFSAWAVNVPL